MMVRMPSTKVSGTRTHDNQTMQKLIIIDVGITIMLLKRETINYDEMLDDPDSIYECLSGRTVDVLISTNSHHMKAYVFKTNKVHKQDYMSVVVRSDEDIENLRHQINNAYGCYLVPVLHGGPEGENREARLRELNRYFKAVLQHRMLRGDRELFAFLFIQETMKPEKSKYERFLERLVDLSRQYLNRMLTRQENLTLPDEESALQELKLAFSKEHKNFQSFASLIEIQLNEQISRYNIAVGSGFSSLVEQQVEKQLLDESSHMHDKSEKLVSIFDEVNQAFRLRNLLRQQIKELKANCVRSRYNSRYEPTDKVLNQHKRKYQRWTEALLRELECNIVLVQTLVRELADLYYAMMQQTYLRNK